MSIDEFSDRFDVLLNSFSKNNPIKLDEYEKSVFLTNAQEELVTEYYNGVNSERNSFESTEEVRRYLSNLIYTAEISPVSDISEKGLTENSQFFKLPEEHKVMFITYESAYIEDITAGCKNNSTILVVPVTQDEFFDIQDNPFRGPNKRRALRLDIKDDYVEIVSKYNISKYTVRYLAEPSPIILEDIGDLEIEGQSKKSLKCDLNPIFHQAILDRAVKLALASKSIGYSNNK